MTTDDIKSVQIIATTKDGKHLMAVSDEKPLIWHIATCCKFAKLKDELFEQCSLKEIMEEQLCHITKMICFTVHSTSARKKDKCYRYWLGKEIKNSGFQYASFYYPEKPVTEGCSYFIDKKLF